MDTNILVQYDGGGYDGCIWEWNFFYIDKDGNFENIASSGSGGIENQKDAEYLIEHSGNSFSSKVYVYHLDNDNDLAEIAKELNPVHLQGLVKWFNDYNVPDVQPYAICGKCGTKVEDANEISLEDWHGCGGIANTADTLLCYECRSMGSCSYCGEYYGDDAESLITTVEQIESKWDLPKNVAETVVSDYAPICEYCIESLVQRELEQMIKKINQ